MFCCAKVAQGGRWASWILLFLALFFLYHTYSRGAWITMMIAAPLFWLRVARRRLLVALGLALVFLAVYPLMSERLSSIDYTDILVESSTGVTSNSYSFRVLI